MCIVREVGRPGGPDDGEPVRQSLDDPPGHYFIDCARPLATTKHEQHRGVRRQAPGAPRHTAIRTWHRRRLDWIAGVDQRHTSAVRETRGRFREAEVALA